MARSAETFLVWGAGGHGRVVADVVHSSGGRVLGFVDRDPDRVGARIPGTAGVVLSEDDFLTAVRDGSSPAGADAVAFGIGDNRARLRALDRLGGYPLPALRHPSAVLSPSAVVGRGSVILPGAVVNAGARVGDAVIVNSAAVIEHDCRLAGGAHISPGAVLAGGVEVGPRSWIGAGATLIPGVRIGADVIVGAGAVVIWDVPDGERVAGVPARSLRSSR